jgi:hypothetical protein
MAANPANADELDRVVREIGADILTVTPGVVAWASGKETTGPVQLYGPKGVGALYVRSGDAGTMAVR